MARCKIGTSTLSAVAILLATFAVASVAAEPPVHDQSGYLKGASLPYSPPPPPANKSSAGVKDLEAVRAAQKVDAVQRDEAYEDAGAYAYDQLLPRFSVAAGTSLTLHTRPILAHMLKRLLADTGNAVGDAKARYPRDRPYREDSSIIPCETDFLYGSDAQSYPSGHAANGYVAALLISDVFSASSEPDRRPRIMERGERYGQNRVVCGVHHPSDVSEGQTIARHVFDAAKDSAEFRADEACAREENSQSPAIRLAKDPAAYSVACKALFALYAGEAAYLTNKRYMTSGSFDPQ